MEFLFGIEILVGLIIAGVIATAVLWIVKGNSAQHTQVRYVSIGNDLRIQMMETKSTYAGPGQHTPDPKLLSDSVAQAVQLGAGYDLEKGQYPLMTPEVLDNMIRSEEERH